MFFFHFYEVKNEIEKKRAAQESLNPDEIPSRVFNSISKEHFSIELQVQDGVEITHLTDLSKSGTYINNVKLVKGTLILFMMVTT